MAATFHANEYKVWDQWGFRADLPGDVGDYVNQRHYGDDCLEGQWYATGPVVVDPTDGCPHQVIYFGTFGNYNSPGASHYTHATVYDTLDPDDMAEYAADLARWEACPEYLDDDDEPDRDNTPEYPDDE